MEPTNEMLAEESPAVTQTYVVEFVVPVELSNASPDDDLGDPKFVTEVAQAAAGLFIAYALADTGQAFKCRVRKVEDTNWEVVPEGEE